MFKILLIFCVFSSTVYAGVPEKKAYSDITEEDYSVPRYWGRLPDESLAVAMNTLNNLPPPKYLTDRRLTQEEVILSKELHASGSAGVRNWIRKGGSNKALFNAFGQLYTAAYLGHSLAIWDMLYFYRSAVRFYTKRDPKPEIAGRFASFESAVISSKREDAKMNWKASKPLVGPRPAGLPPLSVVSGGYVYLPPKTYWGSIAGYFSAAPHSRISYPSIGGGEAVEHDSKEEQSSESDLLLKKMN